MNDDLYDLLLRIAVAAEKIAGIKKEEEPPNPHLNDSISSLNLSVRARRAIEELGVDTFDGTLAQLCSLSEGDLAQQKNCGSTTVEEVASKLRARGLRLRPRKLNLGKNIKED